MSARKDVPPTGAPRALSPDSKREEARLKQRERRAEAKAKQLAAAQRAAERMKIRKEAAAAAAHAAANRAIDEAMELVERGEIDDLDNDSSSSSQKGRKHGRDDKAAADETPASKKTKLHAHTPSHLSTLHSSSTLALRSPTLRPSTSAATTASKMGASSSASLSPPLSPASIAQQRVLKKLANFFTSPPPKNRSPSPTSAALGHPAPSPSSSASISLSAAHKNRVAPASFVTPFKRITAPSGISESSSKPPASSSSSSSSFASLLAQHRSAPPKRQATIAANQAIASTFAPMFSTHHHQQQQNPSSGQQQSSDNRIESNQTSASSAPNSNSADGASSAKKQHSAVKVSISQSGSISIHTPSFRVVDMKKVSHVLSKFADIAGFRADAPLEDMSDKAFIKRHRFLERDEAQIREEERRDSIVRWAICDSPTCRKWRILPKDSSIPTDSNIHWYCGELTSRSGGKPNPKFCEKRDDWIVKCVGERLAKELETAGITTVALLESKVPGQHPPHYATYCQRMRALGLYFDTATQTICKY